MGRRFGFGGLKSSGDTKSKQESKGYQDEWDDFDYEEYRDEESEETVTGEVYEEVTEIEAEAESGEEYEPEEEYEEESEAESAEEYEPEEEYEEGAEAESAEEYETEEEYEEEAEAESAEEYEPEEEYEEELEAESAEEASLEFQGEIVYQAPEEEVYYEEGAVTAPDEEEYEQETDSGYWVREEGAVSRQALAQYRERRGSQGKKKEFPLDKFIMFSGVAILLLAIVIVVGLLTSLNAGSVDRETHEEYLAVGAQIAGIDMIGGDGLLAMADAERARMAAAEAVVQEPEETEPPSIEYEEEEYETAIGVRLNMTSIEKDLKIKFVNAETGKLIGNVPFSVTVTDPSGNTFIWSDDDMDGIIYKKSLTPGRYTVAIVAFTDERYAEYEFSTEGQRIQVKEEIVYEVVDVSDEIKTEDQVDVSAEDTQFNNVTAGDYLADTVEWVESTVTNISYTEVAKSNVVAPAAAATALINPDNAVTVKAAAVEGIQPVDHEDESVEAETPAASEEESAVPGEEPSAEEESEPSEGEPSAEEESEPSEVEPFTEEESEPSEEEPSTEEESAVPEEEPSTEEESEVPEEEPSTEEESEAPEEEPSTEEESGAPGEEPDSQETETGTDVPDELPGNGDDGLSQRLTLHPDSLTVEAGATAAIITDVYMELFDAVYSAESSDANVVSASMIGSTVIVTGIAPGTATVTVKYTEYGQEYTAQCVVTVLGNTAVDSTAVLKDNNGNDVYVLENNEYRLAYAPDYFTAARFYIKGAIKYTGWQTLDGRVYYFDRSGNAVTGEQVIQGVKYNFASDGAMITSSGAMGIDVSKWNGTIDWTAVRNAGVDFVIIRCGYRGSSKGALIQDSAFETNIRGAISAGLKVGVYFFSQAVDNSEALEEASMVLEMIRNYRISYPIFLDVETSGGRGDRIDRATRTSVCRTFCETIQQAGYTAGIYSNKNWLEEKIDAGALGAYKIWLAQYTSAPTYTGRYDMWQYKATGRISGVNGDVDLNTSYLGY